MTMPRRGFLGALALAPAAVAACSTGTGAGKPRARAAEEPDPVGAAPAAAGLAGVRGFALPAGAEPAFTFRASIVRTGEA